MAILCPCRAPIRHERQKFAQMCHGHEPRNRARARMSWYRVADGRIQFRGRITRQPFSEWLSTSDGAETVDAAAGMLPSAVPVEGKGGPAAVAGPAGKGQLNRAPRGRHSNRKVITSPRTWRPCATRMKPAPQSRGAPSPRGGSARDDRRAIAQRGQTSSVEHGLLAVARIPARLLVRADPGRDGQRRSRSEAFAGHARRDARLVVLCRLRQSVCLGGSVMVRAELGRPHDSVRDASDPVVARAAKGTGARRHEQLNKVCRRSARFSGTPSFARPSTDRLPDLRPSHPARPRLLLRTP